MPCFSRSSLTSVYSARADARPNVQSTSPSQRRRQCVRAQRSIHEVVVRDAGEFVEAERHFELTDLNLRVLDVREVDVDVLPLRLRRETLEDLLLGQLLFRELVLDLVLDVFE